MLKFLLSKLGMTEASVARCEVKSFKMSPNCLGHAAFGTCSTLLSHYQTCEAKRFKGDTHSFHISWSPTTTGWMWRDTDRYLWCIGCKLKLFPRQRVNKYILKHRFGPETFLQGNSYSGIIGPQIIFMISERWRTITAHKQTKTNSKIRPNI